MTRGTQEGSSGVQGQSQATLADQQRAEDSQRDRETVDLPPTVAAVFSMGERAWEPFLREFSPFILACVRRLTNDYDDRMEMYAHVCERLWLEDCRRIKQFRGRGDAGRCKFTTWLAAVTLNLCREWIRRTRGRKRVFRAVQSMDRTDQLVFQLHYWDGYTATQIAHILDTTGHPSRSPKDVEAALTRIRQRLSRDQRWRLIRSGFRHWTPLSIDSNGAEGAPGSSLRAAATMPDDAAASGRAVRALRESIRRLPPLQRQALVLRYRHGFSAREIARRLQVRNYKRVYEMQGQAIVSIRRYLDEAGVELTDLEGLPLDLAHE